MPSRNSREIRWAMPNLSNAIMRCFNLFLFGQRHGLALDPPLIVVTLEDAMDINARYMDLIGVQLAGLHQMFDLGDGDIACLRHGSRKIAGGLSKDEVAKAVAFPGLYECKLRMKCQFHQVWLAVEFPYFLTC